MTWLIDTNALSELKKRKPHPGVARWFAVTLSRSCYEKLTGKRVTPEVLVEKSFELLLERESNASILRSFELPVIGRYFPEYETTITKMVTGNG
ncbi:MAG: hypothetical protein WCA32_04410 [Chromatiaceae bacterium]